MFWFWFRRRFNWEVPRWSRRIAPALFVALTSPDGQARYIANSCSLLQLFSSFVLSEHSILIHLPNLPIDFTGPAHPDEAAQVFTVSPSPPQPRRAQPSELLYNTLV